MRMKMRAPVKSRQVENISMSVLILKARGDQHRSESVSHPTSAAKKKKARAAFLSSSS